MSSLLYSRKFWLAVFGIVQALVFHYLQVPDDIWQAIAALVGVLIASIAVEDAGKKMGGEIVLPEIKPEGARENSAPVQ